MKKGEIVVLIALTTLRIDGVKVLEGEKFEVDAELVESLVARRVAKRTRVKAKGAGSDASKVTAPDDGVSGDGEDEDLFDDADDADAKETVGLSVKELRDIAKERGVTGYSSMNREQLIAALEV